MPFDKDRAISEFVTRKTVNEGTTTDNSASYAGSPMVYHCRHCEVRTQTLPETHRERPVTICVDCKELNDNDCMSEARTAHLLAKRDGKNDGQDRPR